jgi:hypothetical protein
MHSSQLGAYLKTVALEITALVFANAQEQPFPVPHA